MNKNINEIILSLIPFYFYVELTWIKIGLDVRIVHITDTHIRKYSFIENEIVSLIKKIKPDIIVHTGDIVDEKGDLDACKKFLSNIDAKYKIAVLGNHDYWRGIKEVIRCVEECDFIVLSDEKINLMGITFTGIDWDDDENWSSHVSKISPSGLILAHSPDVAPFVNSGFILAGHTHGGVAFSQRFTLHTNSKFGFSRGMYKIQNAFLYVSRGLGYVILPVRPFSIPEIVILY
ncbi:MAG: metallophosphoesterase [Thermoprotei archaeon]|jgi:predicted MPP superfamily phosphohydrolase